MSAEAESVLRQALSLAAKDRADVVAELLASIDAPAHDDPSTVRSLWNQEIEWRAKRALSDEAQAEEWSTVRSRIADDLAG